MEALCRGVRADGGRRRRTALSAYLVGNVINAAYVDQNLPASSRSAMVTAVMFLVKALATYGHTVMLAQIGNRIVAHEPAADVQRADHRTSRSSPSGIPPNSWRG